MSDDVDPTLRRSARQWARKALADAEGRFDLDARNAFRERLGMEPTTGPRGYRGGAPGTTIGRMEQSPPTSPADDTIPGIIDSDLPRDEKLRRLSVAIIGVDEPTPAHVLFAALRGFGPAREAREEHLKRTAPSVA